MDAMTLAMDSLDSHLGNPDHTAADEAEWAGFELGYDHIQTASPDPDWDVERARRWWLGFNLGWLARERAEMGVE
jgi:hypothetical protein